MSKAEERKYNVCPECGERVVFTQCITTTIDCEVSEQGDPCMYSELGIPVLNEKAEVNHEVIVFYTCPGCTIQWKSKKDLINDKRS